MDKKIRITYTIGEVDFTAEVNSIPEAYKYLKAIVMSTHTKAAAGDALIECADALVKTFGGSLLKWQNHVYTIELIQKEPKND